MVEVVDIAGHDDGSPAERADVVGDGLELVRGPGGEGDVRAGFGEAACGSGADPAARAGDERDASVEAEPVEQHGRRR